MTAAQKILNKQLYELIKEKCGTVKYFCTIYHYKYDGIIRILKGKSATFDPVLYDIMREQALSYAPAIVIDIILLQTIIKKHWGSIEKFCTDIHIRKLTLLRMFENANINDKKFLQVAYKAYTIYLMQKEDLHADLNLTPAKYLNRKARRLLNIRQLVKKERLSDKYLEPPIEGIII